MHLFHSCTNIIKSCRQICQRPRVVVSLKKQISNQGVATIVKNEVNQLKNMARDTGSWYCPFTDDMSYEQWLDEQIKNILRWFDQWQRWMKFLLFFINSFTLKILNFWFLNNVYVHQEFLMFYRLQNTSDNNSLKKSGQVILKYRKTTYTRTLHFQTKRKVL